MTFKQFYQNIKPLLVKCRNGETVSFTHRGFHGYRFEVKAIKDGELTEEEIKAQFEQECG